MLQGRMQGCYRGAFIHWVLIAELRSRGEVNRTLTNTRNTKPQRIVAGLPNGAHPTSGMLFSPALLRLGLSSHVAPVDTELDATGLAFQSPVPGWLRSSLKESVSLHTPRLGEAERADVIADTASGSSLRSVRRMRLASLAAHKLEDILAERGSGRVLQYRVKWTGFASSQSVTWELGSHLSNVCGFREALERFDTKRALQNISPAIFHVPHRRK